MSKHTPGKWDVNSDGTTVTIGGQCVIVAPAPDGATMAEVRANARLIAAAPKMLEELARLLFNMGIDMPPTVRQRVRSIIAEVEG